MKSSHILSYCQKYWNWRKMDKLKLIVLDLYGQDLQWLDQIFDESKVEYCELFDMKGESNPYIGDIGEFSGWDYLLVPVLKEHEGKIRMMLEQLRIQKDRIVFISGVNLSSLSMDSILPCLTEKCREHTLYKNGLSELIANADSGRRSIWTLISLDQPSLKIMYGEFGKVPDTLAFYLNNSTEDRINSIQKLLDYLDINIPKDGTISCFIVYARVLDAYPLLESVLKAYYPGCRLVLYYGDLVETHAVSVEMAKSRGYDHICTFDKKEAEVYQIPFIQRPFSAVPESLIESNETIKYDVLFIGEAKGRLDQIIEIYEYLTGRGLSCEFYIYRVEEKDMKYPDRIKYNRWLKYEDILTLDSQAKCLLEIMQSDKCYSPTTRHSEAKILRKRLLTNCPELEKTDQKNIIYFKDLSSIDIDSITKPYEEDDINYEEMFSVQHMIDELKLLVSIRETTW